jgi:hypothetical protein
VYRFLAHTNVIARRFLTSPKGRGIRAVILPYQ